MWLLIPSFSLHFHWERLKSAQGCFAQPPVQMFFAERGSLQREKISQAASRNCKIPSSNLDSARDDVALGKTSSPPCRTSICCSPIKWGYKTAPSQRAGKTVKVNIAIQARYTFITLQNSPPASFLFSSAKTAPFLHESRGPALPFAQTSFSRQQIKAKRIIHSN